MVVFPLVVVTIASFTIKLHSAVQGFSNPLCAIRFIMASERCVVNRRGKEHECKMEKNKQKPQMARLKRIKNNYSKEG